MVIPNDDVPRDDGPEDPGPNEKTNIEDEDAPKSANDNVVTYLSERGLLFPFMFGLVVLVALITVTIVVVRNQKKQQKIENQEKQE